MNWRALKVVVRDAQARIVRHAPKEWYRHSADCSLIRQAAMGADDSCYHCRITPLSTGTSMRAIPLVLIFLLSIAPAVADVDPFNTPSGNVQCSAGLGEGEPADVYCTIFERSGPPSIPRLAQCSAAPGYEFSMSEHGTVTVKCSQFTRPASPGGNAVRYGDARRYGGIVCRSSTSGLDCRNADGHGFFLSRARQSVF
jgi:hypothetical protein